MTRDELNKLLAAGEWNDVEFKEARRDVPKSAYDTVAAFANTHGGWLVLGVSETAAGGFAVVGVDTPDKLQNDFLSVLHAGQKVSHDVAITEQRLAVDGKTVLVFRVAENPRWGKAVYLDGDIRRTFLRRGGGDYRAQQVDVERLLRDATADRWDAQPFDRVSLREAFHPGSLRWYRDRFRQVNAGFDREQPDREFLYHWGFLLKAMFADRGPESAGPVRGPVALSPQKGRILALLRDATLGTAGIARGLGRTGSPGDVKRDLKQLLAFGLIDYTIPDKPRSRMQTYRLTEK